MTTPTIELDDASQASLRRAAALLAGIGYAHPDTVDPGTALLCLAAAGRLCPLIGRIDNADVEHRPILDTLADALTLLADLPEPVFGTEAVLDAAADARDAYRLLT